MTSRNFFEEAFGIAAEGLAEMRHSLQEGWFGRHFEPHPTQRQGLDHEQPSPGERGIDR